MLLELGDLLFQKYKDSQIRIGDHFKLARGKNLRQENKEDWENGTIKWINSGILTNLYFLTDKTPISKLITEKAVQKFQLPLVKPNSVLMGNIDPNLNKVVWVKDLNLSIGTDIISFNENIDNFWGSNLNNVVLFFALRQINFSTYITGTIIKRIQTSTLLNMKINWVSNPEKQKTLFLLLNKQFELRNLNNPWMKLIKN